MQLKLSDFFKLLPQLKDWLQENGFTNINKDMSFDRPCELYYFFDTIGYHAETKVRRSPFGEIKFYAECRNDCNFFDTTGDYKDRKDAEIIIIHLMMDHWRIKNEQADNPFKKSS